MKFWIILVVMLVGLWGCSEPDKPTISLYVAIERGDLNQVARHIHWKSDINAFDLNGQAPLYRAAAKGDLNLIKLLLKHGADINLADQNKVTPIQVAVLSAHHRVAKLLVKLGANFDVQALLAQMVMQQVADKETLFWLATQGADLNALDAEGNSLLFYAIANEQLKMVKLLIKQGSQVNLASQGIRPLAQAKTAKLLDISALLMTQGALE